MTLRQSYGQRRSTIFPGNGDPRHGTRNGYNNLGCRCQACRDAWAVTHLEYMRSTPEQQERQRDYMRAKRAK